MLNSPSDLMERNAMRMLFTVVLIAALTLSVPPLVAQVATAPLTVTSTAFANGGRMPKDHVAVVGSKGLSPPLAWTGAPETTRQFALIAQDLHAINPFNPGTPVVLWIVYGIPATASGLPKGMKPGAVESGPLTGTIQGIGDLDFRGRRSGGPAPSFDTAEFARPYDRGAGQLAHGPGSILLGLARTSPIMKAVPPESGPRYRPVPLPIETETPHSITFTVYAIDADLALPEGLDKQRLLAAIDGHVIGKGELTGIFRR